jgi:hypothetical protein
MNADQEGGLTAVLCSFDERAAVCFGHSQKGGAQMITELEFTLVDTLSAPSAA